MLRHETAHRPFSSGAAGAGNGGSYGNGGSGHGSSGDESNPLRRLTRTRWSSRLTKSQIQVLDRTQPGLPLKPGKCGTMAHDYKRNGTTTLFAALS
jgi:hypothetical protein